MGPRTDPWGTPDVTGAGGDSSPSTTTVCCRLPKNACIHLRVCPLTPYWWSLYRSFLKAKEIPPLGETPSHIDSLRKPLPSFKTVILALLNHIFASGQCPENWREAIVIPLPKPGKDPHQAVSYRPISLTSHLCKVMETILNNRLRRHLESEGIMNPSQSGFRQGKCTIDHLVRLETRIRCGMAQGHYTGAVFLDISKAFDLVWHEGLLYKLKNSHITGKMLSFIKSFLLNRSIQVSVNQTLSDKYPLENGTPQGSVISPTLFNIMANDLPDLFGYDFDPVDETDLSQFADDNQISNTDRNVSKLTARLQHSLDLISNWSIKWGFKLSKETRAPRGTDRSPEYNEHFCYKLDSRVKILTTEWNQKQQHFITHGSRSLL